jgi:hypothetical protein
VGIKTGLPAYFAHCPDVAYVAGKIVTEKTRNTIMITKATVERITESDGEKLREKKKVWICAFSFYCWYTG